MQPMTKTIAMMQPYWFPYLGYFQLIAAADAFVLGDDLQYIKDGWINRNRILAAGEPRMISLPLKKAAHGLHINQRQISDEFAQTNGKLFRTLALNYSRAPYSDVTLPLLERILLHPERNLARALEFSIRELCAFLAIGTPILRASDLAISGVQDKQDRVIKTMKQLGGERFLNPIGGLDLYEDELFKRNGIELRFHRMSALSYPQFKGPFVANLSIIDVLMFNPVDQVRQWLPLFTCELPHAATVPAVSTPTAAQPTFMEMYS
jgi:hypothetical protein